MKIWHKYGMGIYPGEGDLREKNNNKQ